MQITVLSQVVFKKGGIPTNTPRGFHVEATWKRSWNPRGVFVGIEPAATKNEHFDVFFKGFSKNSVTSSVSYLKIQNPLRNDVLRK